MKIMSYWIKRTYYELCMSYHVEMALLNSTLKCPDLDLIPVTFQVIGVVFGMRFTAYYQL